MGSRLIGPGPRHRREQDDAEYHIGRSSCSRDLATCQKSCVFSAGNVGNLTCRSAIQEAVHVENEQMEAVQKAHLVGRQDPAFRRAGAFIKIEKCQVSRLGTRVRLEQTHKVR